jgi:hypothetical protein
VRVVIFYRNLLDDLIRLDQFYCADCQSPQRRALIKAAEKGDRYFLVCQDCGKRWTPNLDVDAAARDWVLVLVPDDPIPAAVVCSDCAASHPESATLPAIAHLVPSQSRGPLQ